jgi:hypothetical protein
MLAGDAEQFIRFSLVDNWFKLRGTKQIIGMLLQREIVILVMP